MVTSIASTMGVQPQPGISMTQSIVEWLRGRRLLMLLDNCEHVMAPVAGLARAIVAACDTVTMLATSREPLGVPGERVIPIPSLSVDAGIDLFCDRARAADETVTFTHKDRIAIAAICSRLDGIPLAIELAAARVRSSAPVDILGRLDDRFRLLRGSGRGGLERHQTLQATVAWSYQLLSAAEQLLFDRLSVFAGTFDADAVEAVTPGGPVEELDVVDLLDGLVDKSMVIAGRTERGTRYRLLETLRQYGEERLADRGETTVLRDRHLTHFIDVAERTLQMWSSPRQFEADDRFDQDWDNLRAALHWAVTTDDVGRAERLMHPLDGHAQTRLRHEYGDWLTRTIELSTDDAPVGPALLGRAARWVMYSADYSRALELARRGVDAAPSSHHPDATMPLAVLVAATRASGATVDRRVLDDLFAATAASPDPFMHNWGYGILIEAIREDAAVQRACLVDLERNAKQWGAPCFHLTATYATAWSKAWVDEPRDLAGAAAFYERGLELARDIGDRQWQGSFLANLLFVGWEGDRSHIRRLGEQALSYTYDTRNWWVFWLCAEFAAWSLAAGDDPETAALAYGHLAAHRVLFPDAGWNEARAEGLTLVGALANAAELAARGAAMGRDEIALMMLDHLRAGD